MALTLTLLFALLLSWSHVIYAQGEVEGKIEGEGSVEVENEGRNIEKITVTGSRLKQIHVEGASPVIVLEKKDMEKAGHNSVTDVMRDLPVSSFGARRESSGIDSPGFTGVSLRGMGTGRTLVLIDGKRVQKDALANAVDLGMIPFAAVERIEILKSSASAIYGSDAIGGVVNIITRKDFNGTEASVKYLASEKSSGDQVEVSVTTGYSTSKFNATGVLHHRSNEIIHARDREHSKLGLSKIGPHGSFQILQVERDAEGEIKSIGPYKETDGTTSSRSYFQPIPGCPEDRKKFFEGDGEHCQYNYADHATLHPGLKQTSLMLNANLQIRENINLFTRLSGAHRQAKWAFAPSPAGHSAGLGAFALKAREFFEEAGLSGHPSLADIEDDSFVNIRYRLEELGNRESEVKVEQYNTLVGATVGLGDSSWEMEISGGYNTSSREALGVSGYAKKDELKKLLETSFNPFAASGKRGDLQNLNYKTETTTETDFSFAEASATGGTFDLPSGPVELAVGVQTYKEVFRVDADEATKNDEIIGNAGSELAGERDVRSGYMEFSVPILSSVDWTLAGRHDTYSDFGKAFSPKTAVRWQATPHVMVRSSLGRGFKAPDMDDLYTARSYGYPSFIDRHLCVQKGGDFCAPQQWRVESGGNPNLKEERSLSASLGTVIQPTKNFSIALDAWRFNLENEVGVDLEDVTKAENKFGSNYVEKFGIKIERDPTSGQITSMTAYSQNLSETEVTGIDLSTKFSVSTGIGLWAFGLEHSQLLNSSVVGFPGLDKEDKLGEAGRPKWRNVLSATYAPTMSQSGTLSFRTIGKHEKLLKEKGDLERYTELDFQYTYKGLLGGVLSVGIRNLLGSTPPIDDSNPDAPGIYSGLYDGNGSLAHIQYKYRF